MRLSKAVTRQRALFETQAKCGYGNSLISRSFRAKCNQFRQKIACMYSNGGETTKAGSGAAGGALLLLLSFVGLTNRGGKHHVGRAVEGGFARILHHTDNKTDGNHLHGDIAGNTK